MMLSQSESHSSIMIINENKKIKEKVTEDAIIILSSKKEVNEHSSKVLLC